jgi:hypothetical protein
MSASFGDRAVRTMIIGHAGQLSNKDGGKDEATKERLCHK